MVTPGPHLTFEEQHGDFARPCYCWYVGRGEITGVDPGSLQHPGEYADGAQSAYEETNDI